MPAKGPQRETAGTGRRWLAAAARDLLYALRGLGRRPAFAAVAVLSLAVGIGSAVALVSLVRSILLRPLAYGRPEQLVLVRETTPRAQKLYPDVPANAQHFRFWQSHARSLTGLAAFQVKQATLTGGGEPLQLDLVETTANLFSLLGVRPAAGRSFLPEEEQPGRNRVAVITDRLWRQRFGGSREALGRTLDMDGVPHVLVGVLPPTFHFPRRDDLGPLSRLGERAEIFRPLGEVGQDWRGDFNYNAIARLRPGITPGQARAELDQLQGAIQRAHPEVDAGLRAILRPLQEVLTAPVRSGLYALLAAVGVLLLLVCVNLANLLLANFTARARELAVRSALGASTSALVQQVVAEALALSLAGGLLGTLLAAAVLRVVPAAVPVALPRLDEVQMDGNSLVAALGLVLGCGLLSGFLPAFRLARSQGRQGMGGGRTATAGRPTLRLRELLVACEVGLSVLLLILAGLLANSLRHLMKVDKGWSAERAAAVEISLPAPLYPKERRDGFLDRLLASSRGIPGVRAAGFVSKLPLSGEAQVNPVFPEGAKEPALDPDSNDLLLANIRFASPGYFGALGIPVLQGRGLEEGDRERAVAVVSARLADKVWPGRSPLGRRFRTGSGVGKVEVVGVVADVQGTGLDKGITLTLYVPYWHRAPLAGNLVLRAAGDPAALLGEVRRRVWALDPGLSVPRVRTMAEVVAESLSERRFEMQIALGFALAALLLACLGVYGVVSHGVAERRAEIGVRMALGAQVASVTRLVVARGLRPVWAGLLAGTAAALLLGRLVRGLLFGISAQDPPTLAAAAFVIVTVAVLACLLPALAAARTDPVRALRESA